MADIFDFVPSDGSFQEASLEKLDSIITNTGGVASGSASIVNKFGYNTDVDTATSEVVASFGGAFDPLTDVIDTLHHINGHFDQVVCAALKYQSVHIIWQSYVSGEIRLLAIKWIGFP